MSKFCINTTERARRFLPSAAIQIVIMSILLLSGCGFKLRTTMKLLPPQLHQVYYQTDNPYGQFESIFKRALKNSNVVLLAAPNTIVPILHAVSVYSHSTASSISSASGRVYSLSYTATISLNEASGKLLISPQIVSVSRDVALLPNEIFEITPQIEVAKKELLQELSIKALDILGAPSTFQIFAQQKTK